MAILQIVGSIVTVCLAIVGLHAWHRQLIAKRRFEVAEEALAAFYSAENALKYIRSPFARSSEGKTRPRQSNETPEQLEHRDSLFVPIERVNNASDAFVKVEKAAVLVEIHFGSGATVYLRTLLAARSQVVHAAGMLSRQRESRAAMSDSLIKRMTKWEAVIWAMETKAGDTDVEPEEVDVLTAEIASAKAGIEAACRPYLRVPSLWAFLFNAG